MSALATSNKKIITYAILKPFMTHNINTFSYTYTHTHRDQSVSTSVSK